MTKCTERIELSSIGRQKVTMEIEDKVPMKASVIFHLIAHVCRRESRRRRNGTTRSGRSPIDFSYTRIRRSLHSVTLQPATLTRIQLMLRRCVGFLGI